MLDIQFFKTPFATITKSYRGDNGEMYIEGIASTTNLDQTKERMSPEAIKLMAANFNGKPLNSEHHNDWDDKLGQIIQSTVIEKDGKPALWIKAKLNDWMSRSRDLFTGLNDGHLQLGLSVEGKINPGGLVKEFDETLGRYIPVYKDIAPAAVAITNKPANLDTFVDAVTKSFNIEELPEGKQGSYIVVRKMVDGVPSEDTVCKDELCVHKKCVNKTCKNFCEKCGVAMSKNSVVDLEQEPNPLVDDMTLTCSHSLCPHGQCTGEACKNICKVCTTAKDMGIANAGGIPQTLLARQDIATVGEGKEETETKKVDPKVASPKVANPPNPKEAQGEEQADNSNIYNPPPGKYCTHDYCEHGNCMEGACPNKCSVCSTRQEIKGGENKIPSAPAANTAIVGKDVTNAHQTQPIQYKDVPEDKFLDPENHKYPADVKHLPAALAYFNHAGQRSAGGYSPEKWGAMGRKLAGFLGGGYHYDSVSEKVVQEKEAEKAIDRKISTNDTSLSSDNTDVGVKNFVTEGGELYNMLQHNQGVLQKTPYSQEVMDIIKAWGGANPGNYDLFAKAGASAVSQQPQAPVQQVANGQVQSQQTVQKGSSSSSTSPSSSSDSSTSSDSGSSDSSSTDSSSGSSSSGGSLSSLLSSVLTTLSDMKSSASGSSDSSSSSDSSGSSSSDKTSTDKAFPFQDGSSSSDEKTSTDKAFPSKGASSSDDSSDSYDEATKALSLALANFQEALEKTKKQPTNGKYAENGTPHASALPKEGKDAVNGSAQEADYRDEQKRQHPMPKADTGSTDTVNGKPQEANYNSLTTKSMANQDKFVKSIDTMITLMQKIGEKVEVVEGKVDAMPSVRKGVAIDKQFTEEEKVEFAKSEQARRDMEAKLLADPRVDFKMLHQFRTYGFSALPTWYQQQSK